MTSTPQTPDTQQLIAQGIAHHQAGKFDQAESMYRQALVQDAGNADARYYLGMLAHQAGRFAQALPLVRQAVEARPDNALWLTNLGVVYGALRLFEQSAECHRRATALDPQLSLAWLNLSGALLELGRPAEAEPVARTAIERHAGDFADAHWNLARALFMQGRWTEAFAEHEWRLHKPGISRPQLLSLPTPRWDGAAAPGKTLMLMVEPGYADFIQFLRYAAVAAERCPKVIAECADQMLQLARTVPGVSETVTVFEPGSSAAPPHDLQVPLVSLPFVLGTGDDLQSAGVPYLHPDAPSVAQWRQRLMPSPALNVGIVWSGNPAYERDPSRNMTLNDIAPFAAVRGVRFYGLQIGDPRTPPPWVIQATAAVRNFADVAAIIANLDLVIAVDTAVAHIAGAMGKPVWTLHASVAEHRWGLQSETTAWYPTMRLFRQKRPGDWKDVVSRVTAALTERAGAAKPPVA
jgi:Flp pilus assembly protein TadD